MLPRSHPECTGVVPAVNKRDRGVGDRWKDVPLKGSPLCTSTGVLYPCKSLCRLLPRRPSASSAVLLCRTFPSLPSGQGQGFREEGGITGLVLLGRIRISMHQKVHGSTIEATGNACFFEIAALSKHLLSVKASVTRQSRGGRANNFEKFFH